MLRIDAKKELFLRKPDSGFTIDLWIGLAIALGLHLVLFSLFRITSPPNIENFAPITPVAVEVDLGKPLVSSNPVRITISPMECLEPPSLLEIPKPQFIMEFPFLEQKLLEPDFSEIEKIEYNLLVGLEDDV